MKSHHLLTLATWLITALASINIGFFPFGYDFFRSGFMINTFPMLIVPSFYIIGLAGVISFVMFVMHFTSGCDDSCCK